MAGEEAPAVGIDLGTTYSCVAVWRNNKVEIIANEQGNRTTPSCVAFTDQERLIGEGALSQAARNPINTIFDAKRLIGRRFNEEIVQSDIKLWPFKVVAGDNDKPTIVVRYKGKEERFTPELISSMVLSKMKEVVSTFLGRPVKKAVVTVPAYFSNSQRQSTKDAGEIAELDVIHILNEPTAAALAYGLDNKDLCSDGRKKRILIFDLGGGTFDVSLLELDEHGVLEVKATNGDTHLGGQDFDNRMVNHLVQVFGQKYLVDISKNAKCMRRLKTECEKAKRVLSTVMDTEISIDSLFDGIDFSRRFSRVKFEELNKDLFEKCLGPLEQCLEDAKVERDEVDEVVLVGGSTRIPKVQQLLRDFFNGKEPSHRINEDEAVAYGAAIQAASLHKGSGAGGPDVVLLDVTPLSLGIENDKHFMYVVVPKNTRIPCEIETVWDTSEDYQTSAWFQIYEGERPMAVDNNLLGDFTLSGLRPALKYEIKFLVLFKMDENGILRVSARNEDNGDKADITITRDKLTSSKEEIDRMIRDARRFESEDNERKKAVLAKHELEDYANKIRNLIQEYKVRSRLKNDWRQQIEYAINGVKEWLEESDNVPYYEFQERKHALERVWEPIGAMVGIEYLNI